MSTFSLFSFYLVIFAFLTLTLNSIPILSLQSQSLTGNPNFDPDTAISGDAELVGGFVRLNRPAVRSNDGSILHKKNPFKFIQSSPVSFSTDFTFSISPQNVHARGLALEIKSASNSGKCFGVRFNGNDVWIEVGDRFHKLSSPDLFLSNGEKVQSWVDYEASSKRIEIRVGKFGSQRPYNPVLVYPIDLLKMWNEEEVFAGLSSSRDENAKPGINVYSWRFRVRDVPKRLHSQPINPQQLTNQHIEQETEGKKRFCHLRVLTFGCGALLVATIVLSLWALFVARNNDMAKAEENDRHPADFRYRKINVVVDNGFGDIKK